MATYTPNYGLHQWVPEDQFRREDFNEDFQKLDKTLGRTEQMLLGLYRSLPCVLYPLFDCAIKDYAESHAYPNIKNLILDGLDNQDKIASLGGRLTMQLGNVVLPWDADPAAITTVPFDLTGIHWSHATIWIRCEPQADYRASVNNLPATQTGKRSAKTADGKIDCAEVQFDVEIPSGGSSAVVALTLTAIEHTPPRIYEYGVFFF